MPFTDLIGHRRLVSLLSRAVNRDTLPPSLLLAGPRGVGKRRVAVAIAQTVNCIRPRIAERGALLERDACGTCPSCSRIARGVHPDIVTIEPGDTGTIKIDQIRDLIDRANYRPFEARRRVVIIDDADAMLPPAQSALLKTLEEPPSASSFMLVSSMPDALLPTVLSRCPRVRFGALTPQEVAEILVRDHAYTQADATAVAADADGSVGRALSADSSDAIAAREDARRVLAQLARTPDAARRLEVARGLTGRKGSPGAEREQLAACLRALSSLLRDLGMMAARGSADVLANADLEPELQRAATAFDEDRSVKAFRAVDDALGALERNASPKVVADWLVLQV